MNLIKLNNLIRFIDVNLKGAKIKQKCVIIESDDWGSIRMPDKQVYYNLLDCGIPVDRSAYCKYDTLENENDIDELVNVLISVKNTNGEHPVLTANFVTANPDFEKIRENAYQQYFYEPLTKTYYRYGISANIIQKILSSKVINIQFHGRDHVNVPLWLDMLKHNHHFKKAFEYQLWGLSNDVFPQMAKSIQATYDSDDSEYCKNSLTEGLNLFSQLFGYPAESFIAGNFIWSNVVEHTLSLNGIKYIQGMKYQLLPLSSDTSNRKKIRHYYGEQNKYGQYYGIRNCSFEPTEKNDTVEDTLKQIQIAFMFNKPAVISTHRINFVSRIDKKNRDKNLIKFQKLLKAIVQKWPDVQFKSSGEFINFLQK